ncbi:MAG: porin family protein [Acidobacteria bacterium]|nr:porin family protein [Acidobacteriota bacterium]
MRKLLFIAALMMFALPLLAQAQDKPRAEIFGGYSYLRADDDVDGLDLHGWNASGAINFNKWLGVVSDFSGHYGDVTISPTLGKADLSTYLFLAGPRFTYRGNERVTPFGHILFGAARSHVDFFDVVGNRVRVRDTAFAMAVGGGLDVKVVDALAIRLFQADYVLTRFNDDNQNNFRLSTGLVLRLGKQ